MADRPPIRTARRIGGRMVLCFLVVILIALCGSARIPAQSGTAQTPPPAVAQGKDTAPSNQKIAGLSVIVKSESGPDQPLFHADGYRIRISVPGTITEFNGTLKSLADVTPGAWIRFQGTRDDSGIVVASRAAFFSAGTRNGLTKMGPSKVKKAPDYRPVLQESLINAEGDLVSALTTIPPKDADALCAWYKVPADAALQDRVERIGLRLVPAYQKQLAPDSPAQISFRFYVVTDTNVAPALDCKPGLVLVPRRFVERVRNDDQLAAVLADRIALNLMGQLSGLRLPDGQSMGAALATGLAAGVASAGGGGWGVWPAEMFMMHQENVQLEQQSARIALQLMAHAGFDPWQAPEAWRLLAPKKPPANPQSLKYTREGQYQLTILNLQYKRTDLGGPASTERAGATD